MIPTWTDAYLIGDDQIDQQHMSLVKELEALTRCVNDEEAVCKRCRQSIGFLKAYVVHHFSAEELLMERIGYPDTEAHYKQHAQFKDDLHEIELTLIRNDYCYARVREVISFLTKWWIFHIVKEDHKIAAYMPKGDAHEEETKAKAE